LSIPTSHIAHLVPARNNTLPMHMFRHVKLRLLPLFASINSPIEWYLVLKNLATIVYGVVAIRHTCLADIAKLNTQISKSYAFHFHWLRQFVPRQPMNTSITPLLVSSQNELIIFWISSRKEQYRPPILHSSLRLLIWLVQIRRKKIIHQPSAASIKHINTTMLPIYFF